MQTLAQKACVQHQEQNNLTKKPKTTKKTIKYLEYPYSRLFCIPIQNYVFNLYNNISLLVTNVMIPPIIPFP